MLLARGGAQVPRRESRVFFFDGLRKFLVFVGRCVCLLVCSFVVVVVVVVFVYMYLFFVSVFFELLLLSLLYCYYSPSLPPHDILFRKYVL